MLSSILDLNATLLLPFLTSKLENFVINETLLVTLWFQHFWIWFSFIYSFSNIDEQAQGSNNNDNNNKTTTITFIAIRVQSSSWCLYER